MSALIDSRGVPTPRLLEQVRAALGTVEGAGEDLHLRVLEVVAALAPVRGHAELERVGTWITDRLTGLGPLQELAGGRGVTDVLVTPRGEVWVDDANGLRRAALRLNEAERRGLGTRLLALGGRRLDEAQPFGDAVVGGIRVHAVIPPVSQGGTALSLRVLGSAKAHLEELFPTPGDPWAPWLRHAVDSRLNVLVSGGTGAGKTTLVAALLAACPPTDRLVLVEDASELAPDHAHVVALQARPANAEGAGEVPLAELIRQALRMRPDRLVVGECRGAEVRDLLMALNTGHSGAAGTLHANGAQDVPARLVALGALAGWDERTTALHAAAAIDVVIHVERTAQGRRPTRMVRLLHRDGRLITQDIVNATADGAPAPGPAFEWFAARDRARGADGAGGEP